jgi:hypothetical protein
MYLWSVGGNGGGNTEFGLVSSMGELQPVFVGLPAQPRPSGEVEIGHVAKGSRLRIYLKTWGKSVSSDFGRSTEADQIFWDGDNSLGRNGSIVERTGPTTWVLHLDDLCSGDDDDDDFLIQIRLEPDAPE